MSTTIDQRVVEMRFDNKHFESNVQTSMSTIDKLKEKLNFKGAEKGFENISAAANKVDMNTLGKSVEAVQAKFSALEVVGVTALVNITNSAVNAGKRLAKSLSVDQVTAGWSKYEQKTASVQTIMNATGKSIDEVNGYLQKLMWFSDETSYGFNDMTAALGQMTSSGGNIDKLIPLITGVANATAYAGKGASEFSRVMYNLNQSYGAGYLQLMDWKSVELAGVGSKQLKQVFIDTAEAMGKIKKGQVTISNFSTTLKDKWADTEVMEAAFGKFGEFSDAVYKLSEDIDSGNLSAYPEDIQKLAKDGQLNTASQMIEALSEHYDELGTKAFKSAQEAKTFTEAIDATKDAVSSGWMKTFELIFGTYVDQKKLWTDLANGLWEVFASGGDSRNEWLEEVLNYNPLVSFSEKLKDVTKAIEAPVKKLEEYNDIVNRIIRGDFGNGQTRWDKLTEAGYDWAHAQNLVNEKLGSSVRHATDYDATQEKLIETTVELTDAKLEEIGLTKDEIKLYRELEAESKKTGKSIGELINEMEKADARTLLLDSFRNIGNGLLGVIRSIKEAFADIFPAPTAIQIYNIIKRFNELTSALRLINTEEDDLNETGQKLKRTFKGIFAALDIILTIVGGPIKIAFKVLAKLLGSFNIPILDMTASIGDAIVAFRDWIDEVLDFNKVFEYLSELFSPMIKKVQSWIESFKGLPVVQQTITKIRDVFSKGFETNPLVKGFSALWSVLEKVAKGLKKCFDAFMDLPVVQNVVGKIGEVFSNLYTSIMNGLGNVNLDSILSKITSFFDVISEWINGLGEQDENGSNLIAGLGNAIGAGVKVVVDAITEICKAIYNTFTTFFGIHSPSVVFFTLGKFCIAGLVAGLLFARNDTVSAMSEIGASLLEGLKNAIGLVVDALGEIDLRTVFAVGGAVAMFKTVNNITNMLDKFGAGVKGFGTLCSEAGGLIKDFRSKVFPQEKPMEKTSNIVLKMAAAIGILAASIYMLAQLDSDKLWSAVGAIAALAVILGLLTLAAAKLKVNGGDFGKLSLLIIGFAGTLFIMSLALKNLEFLTFDNIIPVLLGFAGIVGAMVILLYAFGKLTKGTIAKNIDKASIVIGKIALTMLLLTFTLKQVSKLSPGDVGKGLITIGLFGAFITALIAVTKKASKDMTNFGMTILQLSAAIILLVGVIKLISKLDGGELTKGITCVVLLGAVITGLIAATRLAGGQLLGDVGTTMIAIAGAILILSFAVKLMSSMEVGAFVKGIVCVALLGAVIAGLIKATSFAGGTDLKGVAGTLLAASLAIGMLAAIAIVLSLVSLEGLAKGITAVSMLGGVMALLIWATRGASDCKANIVAMTTAIAMMAASLFVLTLLDPAKLASATMALTTMMGMFALLIKMSGDLAQNGKKFGKTIGILATLTGVIAVIAGVLYLLGTLDNPDAVLASAIGIGIILATLAVSLAIIDGNKTMSKEKLERSVKMLYALTGVVAALGLIIGLMSKFGNPQGAIACASALSILVVSLSGVLAVLSNIKVDTKGAMKGMLALTAMVVPLAVFAAALHFLPSIADKQKDIILLTAVVVIMSGLAIALSTVGLIVSGSLGMALIGIVGLVAMVVPLAVFAAALYFLPSIADKEKDIILLTAVVTIMTGLLIALSVLGPLVGFGLLGIAGLIEMLPHLKQFAKDLKNVPDISASEEKIKTLVRVLDPILDLCGKLAIISLLDIGDNNLKNFANQLSAFGEGIVAFNKKVSGEDFNPSKIKKAAKAGIALAEMAKEIPGDWGNNNLTNFANQLKGAEGFGEGLKDFNDKIKGEDFNPSKIKKAAKAGLELAKTAKEIPGDVGNNNLINFGNQMEDFGDGLLKFDSKVGGEDFNASKVKKAAKAGLELAKLAKEIPGDVGNNNLINFGNQMESFGQGLWNFAAKVGGETFNANKVKKAAQAGVDLAKAAKEIPGDWGNDNITNFATQIGTGDNSLGAALSKFSEDIKDIESPNKLSAAAKAAKDIAIMAKEIPGDWGNDNITNFAKQFGGESSDSLGSALNTFSEKIKNVEPKKLTAAVKATSGFIDSAIKISEKEIPENAFGGISGKLGALGKDISDFADAVTSVDPATLDSAANATSKIVTAIVDIAGATEGEDKKIDTTALTTVTGQLEPFGNAIKGFANAVGTLDYTNADAAAGAAQKVVNAMAIMTDDEKGIDLDTLNLDENFVTQLTTFGDGINQFATKLTALKPEDLEASATAAKTAMQAIKTIAGEEGTIGEVFDNAEQFKTDLGTFGDSIAAFGDSVANINATKAKEAASAATEIIKAAKSIGEGLGDSLNKSKDRNGNDVSIFTNKLTVLGQGVSAFHEQIKEVSVERIQNASDAVSAIAKMKVPDASDIDAANSSLTELVEVIKTLGGLDAATIDSFKTNLQNLGESGIKQFVESFATPNQTVTDAIDGFIASVAETIGSYASEESSIYTSFYNVGDYAVQGFAKGIIDNKADVTAAGTKLGEYALTAAKKRIDSNSPSKEFMKVGGFVVSGFAKGITDDLGTVKESGITLGDTLLKATQKNLGINSPSLVFKEEVGRWIVKGVEEGLKDCKTAEKKAEKLAQNITEAFSKKLNLYDLDSEIASKDFELWELQNGDKATKAEKEAKELEYLNGELARNNDIQKLAHDEWQETVKYLKEGKVTAEAEKEAWSKYYDAQIKTAETRKKISDIEGLGKFTKEYDNIEKAIDIRSKLQENWLKTDARYASGDVIDKRLLKDAEADLVNLQDELSIARKQHEYAIEHYAVDSEEVLNAYDLCIDLENRIADKEAEITAIQQSNLARQLDNANTRLSYQNNQFDYAKARLGIDARDEDLDRINLTQAAENIESLKEIASIEKKEWLETQNLWRQGKATLEDVDKAKDEYIQALTNVRNAENEEAQLKVDIAEREHEALEKQYDIAADNADLQYQIWEKTTGRKATGAEKDVAKLSSLSQQLLAQSSLLGLAREEWEKAVDKYGQSSNEAQQAYSDYLQKQLDIANLQNEISDINDKSVERQKAAHSEYKKYIEKYEKYYLKNGMTREDLERDAKLVSGYDPTQTVNTMIDKTKQALDTVQESDTYSEVLNGFSSMGTSYVTAVNEGVSSQASAIIATMTQAVDDCASALKEKRPLWRETGVTLTDGFAGGISSGIPSVISVVDRMAQQALATIKSRLGIHSPSKEFANVGMYAIMGLAKGLTDNVNLTNSAVSAVADNAIAGLKNTISRISDFIESDIDTQPTIRPVLDLSDVESGAARLNAMMSRSQAMSINNDMARNSRSEEIQNGVNNTSNGNTYTFTQNNYSPKALSRADIYRQTKNQFAAMKEVLV